MNNIEFIKSGDIVVKEDYLFVDIKVVHSEKELLTELNEKLALPDYFGFNWDALWDLYRDFYWISQTNIIIRHQGITALPENDLIIYIGIVVDTCKSWREYPEHNISFFFPTSERDTILRLKKEYELSPKGKIIEKVLSERKLRGLFPFNNE